MFDSELRLYWTAIRLRMFLWESEIRLFCNTDCTHICWRFLLNAWFLELRKGFLSVAHEMQVMLHSIVVDTLIIFWLRADLHCLIFWSMKITNSFCFLCFRISKIGIHDSITTIFEVITWFTTVITRAQLFCPEVSSSACLALGTYLRLAILILWWRAFYRSKARNELLFTFVLFLSVFQLFRYNCAGKR